MHSAARHSGKNAIITCLAPDVCKTPVGSAVVPIPYMIISKLNWSQQTISHTKLTGLEAFNMDARTDKVTGDEPGTLGGIKPDLGCSAASAKPGPRPSTRTAHSCH